MARRARRHARGASASSGVAAAALISVVVLCALLLGAASPEAAQAGPNGNSDDIAERIAKLPIEPQPTVSLDVAPAPAAGAAAGEQEQGQQQQKQQQEQPTPADADAAANKQERPAAAAASKRPQALPRRAGVMMVDPNAIKPAAATSTPASPPQQQQPRQPPPPQQQQQQQQQRSSVVKAPCAAGDQCCAFGDSPASCGATENRNKGCRSHYGCVPAADPCAGAANAPACEAVGPFCKFDINTFGCVLDAVQHPCAAIADSDACAASATCALQHGCRDTCAMCPACLAATRIMAGVPKLMRSMDGGGMGEDEAAAFFRGFCQASATDAEPSLQREIMRGCALIADDAARSPALLARPAALCSRLGMCQQSCRVPAPAAPGGASAVDLCSPSGLPANATAPSALAAATAAASLITGTTTAAAASDDNTPLNKSPAPLGGACLSSGDCAAGLDCDAFSAPTCHSACDPETGMDRCLPQGTCVDVCERPDVKAAVRESRRRVRPCASADACAAGEECRVPDFACTVVTCNAHALSEGRDAIELRDCPQVCVPRAPRMLNATFSDDGGAILVKLNQEAAPLEALCFYMFDEPTSALLGAAATCATRGDVLTIRPAGDDVRVRPGSPLTLDPWNEVLVAAVGSDLVGGRLPFAGGLMGSGGGGGQAASQVAGGNATAAAASAADVGVEACRDCSKSAIDISLRGPPEIAVPCSGADSTAVSSSDDDDLDAFTFAAGLPSSALWKLERLEWRLLEDEDAAKAATTPPAGSYAALRSLVDELNAREHLWDRLTLAVPFSQVPGLPDGPATLQVAAVNAFGVASAANLTFVKKASTEAPLFELDKSLARFTPSRGFRVVARPLRSACPPSQVLWRWTTTIPGVQLADDAGTSAAFPAAELLGNVEVGKEYNVTVTAQYKDSAVAASDTLTVRAEGSPLVVRLAGPSGTVMALPSSADGSGSGAAAVTSAANLTYDASGSLDPDDPYNTAGQLSFLWACHSAADLSPCFGSQLVGGAGWTIDPAKLTPGQRYVVGVTIAKGDRSATASRAVTPRTSLAPAGQVQRSCGFDLASGAPLACPPRHNPSDPLTLVAVPDADFADNVTLSWWVDPASTPGLALDDTNTAAGTARQTLTVLPGGLPSGGSVTINVNMTLKQPPQQQQQQGGAEPLVGVSSITVPLNGAPYCSAGPNAPPAVAPPSGVAPAAQAAAEIAAAATKAAITAGGGAAATPAAPAAAAPPAAAAAAAAAAAEAKAPTTTPPAAAATPVAAAEESKQPAAAAPAAGKEKEEEEKKEPAAAAEATAQAAPSSGADNNPMAVASVSAAAGAAAPAASPAPAAATGGMSAAARRAAAAAARGAAAARAAAAAAATPVRDDIVAVASHGKGAKAGGSKGGKSGNNDADGGRSLLQAVASSDDAIAAATASAVSEGCLSVEALGGAGGAGAPAAFPRAAFRACAVAWADPDGDDLSYEFGVVDARTGAFVELDDARGAPCFTFDALPPGRHELYACAVDALGARACQTTSVQVAPPPAGASPTSFFVDADNSDSDSNDDSQVRVIDIDALAGAGDASSLVDAANQLASALAYSAQRTVGSVFDFVDGTLDSIGDALNSLGGGLSSHTWWGDDEQSNGDGSDDVASEGEEEEDGVGDGVLASQPRTYTVRLQLGGPSSSAGGRSSSFPFLFGDDSFFDNDDDEADGTAFAYDEDDDDNSSHGFFWLPERGAAAALDQSQQQQPRDPSSLRLASPKFLKAAGGSGSGGAAAGGAAASSPAQQQKQQQQLRQQQQAAAAARRLRAARAATANTTNRLLRAMADAGSPRDADLSNSLLTAGAQLGRAGRVNATGGRALLQMFDTAMAANANAQRTLAPPLSNAAADALTRGVGAALTRPSAVSPAPTAAATTTASSSSGKAAAPKPAHQQQQQQHRRRSLLQAATSPNNASSPAQQQQQSLLEPAAAFEIIRDGAHRLALAQRVQLGEPNDVVGNAGLCIAPALLPRAALSGRAVGFGCPGVAAPPRVTLPSNLSAACGASAACSAGGALLLLGTYFPPDSRSVPLVMSVVDGFPHLIPADRSLSAGVVSGVMNVTLNYTGPGGAFCPPEGLPSAQAADNSSSAAAAAVAAAGCAASLELPLSAARRRGHALACVHLTPAAGGPGRLNASDALPVAAIDERLRPDGGAVAVARCVVPRQGLWVVAEFDAAAAEAAAAAARAAAQGGLASGGAGGLAGKGGGALPASGFSAADAAALMPSRDHEHAQVYRFAFDLDYAALASDVAALTRFRQELQQAVLSGLAALWSDGPSLADAQGALKLGFVSVEDAKPVGGQRNSGGGNQQQQQQQLQGVMGAGGGGSGGRAGVVAEVTFAPPAGTTPAQLAKLSSIAPAELLASDALLRARLVSAILVRDGAGARRGLSGAAVGGIAAGCAVAVAALAALAAALVVRRRRRAATAQLQQQQRQQQQQQTPPRGRSVTPARLESVATDGSDTVTAVVSRGDEGDADKAAAAGGGGGEIRPLPLPPARSGSNLRHSSV